MANTTESTPKKAGVMTIALGKGVLEENETKSLTSRLCWCGKVAAGATAGWFTRGWFKNLTGLGLTAEEKAKRAQKKAAVKSATANF
jgi:hypothetical protein